MRNAGAACAMLLCMLLTGACVVVVQPAAIAADETPARQAEVPEAQDWPARDVGDGVEDMGAIYSVGNVSTRAYRTSGHESDTLSRPMFDAYEAYRAVAPPLAGDERTMVYTAGEPSHLVVGPKIRFGQDGAVWVDTFGEGAAHTETMVFVTGVLEPASEDRDDPTLHVQRTWYQLVEPSGERVRGVVVLLPGMFGTPRQVIDRLVRRLRGEGYAVVRFLAHPERFTERVVFGLDPADLASSADEIARVLTDRAAECAYAVEAALRDIETRRPQWRGAPVAAIGMSGGAMVLPTVIARDVDRFDAAIYIAGGSDFWRIAQESNYRLWIDSVSWLWRGGSPTNEPGNRAPADGLRTRLNELYLERAPLDGVRTAPVAARVPTLMLHGSTDRAVPAARGDDLWRALGEPDRRVLPVGHELLFLALPGQFGEMIEWLDDTLSTD